MLEVACRRVGRDVQRRSRTETTDCFSAALTTEEKCSVLFPVDSSDAQPSSRPRSTEKSEAYGGGAARPTDGSTFLKTFEGVLVSSP